MASTSGLTKIPTAVWVGGAALVGGALAMMMAGGGGLGAAAKDKINQIAGAYPASINNAQVAMGQRPIYSRAFPDRSNLFNSLPSPMVEHNVPFDSSGRWAQVTGL